MRSVDTTSGLGDASAPLLQPIWSAIRAAADTIEPGVWGHPLFFAVFIITTVIVVGLAFTVADVWTGRLSARAALRYLLITLPGYVAAFVLLRWLPIDHRIEAPVAAPSLARFALELSACLVVADLASYWWHRLEHGSRLVFTKVHYVHHDVTSPLTVWSGFYVHPVESACVFITFYAFPVSVGVHPLTLATFAVMSTAITMVTHCGYDVPLYPTTLFASASMHEHHHGGPEPKNFSVLLGLSDRLFGTFKA